MFTLRETKACRMFHSRIQSYFNSGTLANVKRKIDSFHAKYALPCSVLDEEGKGTSLVMPELALQIKGEILFLRDDSKNCFQLNLSRLHYKAKMVFSHVSMKIFKQLC